MKKIGITLMLLALSVVLCGPANATLINGGFEDGLNGWTLTNGSGAAVSTYSSSYISLLPQEGSYFLQLELLNMAPGNLIQDVALNAGDVISGWSAFELAGTAKDIISMKYNGTSDTVWEVSSGSGSWTYWSWTASETDTYTLGFYTFGMGVPGAPGYSRLFVDNISVTSAPVPEPATMLLLGSGLIGLAGFRKRFRKG